MYYLSNMMYLNMYKNHVYFVNTNFDLYIYSSLYYHLLILNLIFLQFYLLYYPKALLSYLINKNINNYKITQEDIKFSSDLNKTSLKNINRKNITNLSKIINNKSNQEILMLNKICNYFIQNNKENVLINILNNYTKDITIKEIELCLKIDKTTDFSTLCSKDKKKIIKSIIH